MKGYEASIQFIVGFYEEFKGTLDKIITACEEGDYDTAFFTSIHVQDETARFLYFAEKGHWPTNLTSHSAYNDGYIRAGLPELIPLLDVNRLSVIQVTVERLSTLPYWRSAGRVFALFLRDLVFIVTFN